MSRQSDPGFWTSCPACCHVHQYGREYLNLKLRCPSCRRPFVAVELSSPPPVVPGTEMYYCTWGFFPLGFPQGPTPPTNWAPLRPSNDQPSTRVDPQPVNPAPQKTTSRKKVLAWKGGVSNGGALEEEDEEVFRGIDVNMEATVSDLMGDDGNHTDGIGFNIDVDVDAAGEDVFVQVMLSPAVPVVPGVPEPLSFILPSPAPLPPTPTLDINNSFTPLAAAEDEADPGELGRRPRTKNWLHHQAHNAHPSQSSEEPRPSIRPRVKDVPSKGKKAKTGQSSCTHILVN